MDFDACLLAAANNARHLAEQLVFVCRTTIKKETGNVCHVMDRAEPPLIDANGGSTSVMEPFCDVVTLLGHVTQNGFDGGVLVGASESKDTLVGCSPAASCF